MTTTISPPYLIPTTAAIIPRGARPIARDDYDFTEKNQTMPGVSADGNVISAKNTSSWFADSGENLSVVAVEYAGKNIDITNNTVLDSDVGKLTFSQNGEYTFVPNTTLLNSLGSSSAELTFSYTIKDSSGQTSTAHLVISVLNPESFYEQFVYSDSTVNVDSFTGDTTSLLATAEFHTEEENKQTKIEQAEAGATGFFTFAEHSSLLTPTTTLNASNNKPKLAALQIEADKGIEPHIIEPQTSTIQPIDSAPIAVINPKILLEENPEQELNNTTPAAQEFVAQSGMSSSNIPVAMPAIQPLIAPVSDTEAEPETNTETEAKSDTETKQLTKEISLSGPLAEDQGNAKMPPEGASGTFEIIQDDGKFPVIEDNEPIEKAETKQETEQVIESEFETETEAKSDTETKQLTKEISLSGPLAEDQGNAKTPPEGASGTFEMIQDEGKLPVIEDDEHNEVAQVEKSDQEELHNNEFQEKVTSFEVKNDQEIFTHGGATGSYVPENVSTTSQPLGADKLPMATKSSFSGFDEASETSVAESPVFTTSDVSVEDVMATTPDFFANDTNNSSTTATPTTTEAFESWIPKTTVNTSIPDGFESWRVSTTNQTIVNPVSRGGLRIPTTNSPEIQTTIDNSNQTSRSPSRGGIRVSANAEESTSQQNLTTTLANNIATTKAQFVRGGIRSGNNNDTPSSNDVNDLPTQGGATGFNSFLNSTTLQQTTFTATTFANGRNAGTTIIPATTQMEILPTTTTKRAVKVNDVASNNDEAAISYESDDSGRAEMNGLAAHGNVLANDTNSTINFNNNQLEVSLVNGNQVYGNTISIQGKYGELVMNKNGSYTYEAINQPDNMRATEVFTYTVLNKQTGMRATATLTVTIADFSIREQANENNTNSQNDQVVISDSHGINTYSDSGVSSVLANDPTAVYVVGVGGGDVNQKIIGTFGNLVMDEFGHYAYTPNGRSSNSDSASVDSFVYQVKFADGQTLDQTLSITIKAPEVIRNHQEINGDDGNNVLYADQNNYSTIVGGAGSDTMYSVGNKTNTFTWRSEDLVDGSVDQDTIYGFKNGSLSDGSLLYVDGNAGSNAGTQMGDQLNLRDLLNLSLVNSPSATQANILKNYIHFEQKGNDTIIHVDKDGSIRSDGASDDLRIVLKGIDLTHHGSGQALTDQTIIEELLQKNKLLID